MLQPLNSFTKMIFGPLCHWHPGPHVKPCQHRPYKPIFTFWHTLEHSSLLPSFWPDLFFRHTQSSILWLPFSPNQPAPWILLSFHSCLRVDHTDMHGSVLFLLLCTPGFPSHLPNNLESTAKLSCAPNPRFLSSTREKSQPCRTVLINTWLPSGLDPFLDLG